MKGRKNPYREESVIGPAGRGVLDRTRDEGGEPADPSDDRSGKPSHPDHRDRSTGPRAGAELINRLIHTPELQRLFGVSRTTLWQWRRQGLLPPPRQLGPNTIAWVAEEIEAFLASRPRV
jgi:prophage regulatory protein